MTHLTKREVLESAYVSRMQKLREDVNQKFKNGRFIIMNNPRRDPFFNNKIIDTTTLDVFVPGNSLPSVSIVYDEDTLNELLNLRPDEYVISNPNFSGGRYAPKRKMHRLR
jgi:hypothetical protein